MYAKTAPPRTPIHGRRPSIDDELYFHEPAKVTRETVTEIVPPPETCRAHIICYSNSCGTATAHLFIGRRLVKNNDGLALYHELVFRCCLCNKERVWGTETANQD